MCELLGKFNIVVACTRSKAVVIFSSSPFLIFRQFFFPPSFLQVSEQEGLVVLVTVLPANRVRPKRLCKKSHFVDCRITCLQPEFNGRQLPTLALFYLWPLWSENIAGSSRIAKILLMQVDLYCNGNRSAFRNSDDNAL